MTYLLHLPKSDMRWMLFQIIFSGAVPVTLAAPVHGKLLGFDLDDMAYAVDIAALSEKSMRCFIRFVADERGISLDEAQSQLACNGYLIVCHDGKIEVRDKQPYNKITQIIMRWL